jgi:hypothetical protein
VVADSRRRQARRAGVAALIVVAGALGFASPGRSPQPPRVNESLPWHTAELDAAGNLQPWYRPRGGLGYDHVLRLGWAFIDHSVPVEGRTGRRVYLNYAVFDPPTRQGTYWQHDPAELYAAFVDSLLPWYAYSGDRTAITRVREMLDYQLSHGTSPTGWAWPRVPFATSCAGDERYGRCLAGMPRTFYGGVEPDKIGLLGLGYARFYELTGERKYLLAALWCADELAHHVRAGDVARSPWPFRLDARTGRPLEHAEYGGMTVAPVWLFDELIRLRAGDTTSFARARDLAWRWILRYPLNPGSSDWNRWSGHYEDIDYDPDDLNQATPTMTALYLLMHPDPGAVDPAWRQHVRGLLAWVRSYLGRGPFDGAWGIDEQRRPGSGGFGCCSAAGLGSDTARWAAATLLLSRRTDDADAHATGRHSLAYATYFMQSDGVVSCCGAHYPDADWFSDGYADYLKGFSWALAADPQLAPPHQDHVLASTSVVQRVTYTRRRVSYRTFARRSVEILRLSFVPSHVSAGGRALPRRHDLRRQGFVVRQLGHGDVELRLRHDDARRVVVSGI